MKNNIKNKHKTIGHNGVHKNDKEIIIGFVFLPLIMSILYIICVLPLIALLNHSGIYIILIISIFLIAPCIILYIMGKYYIIAGFIVGIILPAWVMYSLPFVNFSW